VSTAAPTASPTVTTAAPTDITVSPSNSPTASSTAPSASPTAAPMMLGGVAFDGYFSDCTVFLDVDGDDTLSDGDLSTTTSARGVYNLLTPDRADGETLVLTAAGAPSCVDVFTDITPKLLMMAPTGLASNQSVMLSPLSTLAHAVGRATQEQAALIPTAADMVNGLLGLTVSPVDGLPVNVLQWDSVREVVVADQLKRPSSGAFLAGTMLTNTGSVVYAYLNGTARSYNMTNISNSALSGHVWDSTALALLNSTITQDGVLNSNVTIMAILQSAVEALLQEADDGNMRRMLLQTAGSSSMSSVANKAVSINNIIRSSANRSAAEQFAGTSRSLRYSATTLAVSVEQLGAGELDEEEFETMFSEEAMTAGVAAVVLPTSTEDLWNQLISENSPPTPPVAMGTPAPPPPSPPKEQSFLNEVGEWIEDHVLYSVLIGVGFLLATAGSVLACMMRRRRTKQAVLATFSSNYSDLERMPSTQARDPYALGQEYNLAPEATPLPAEMNKTQDAANKKDSEAAERAEFEKILQEQQQYIAKRLGGV